MDLNNITLILLLASFSFIFYKYFLSIINNINPQFLIDNQFTKPQAFHNQPTSIAGGICIYISFLILCFYFFLFKNLFLLNYLLFCSLFFTLGFLDDIKIDIKPKIILFLIILFLIIFVKYTNFYIEKTGIETLDYWLLNSNLFSLLFISLCFLFIINGANLIDGYNGLLGFHSLIILINLFFVNFINGNNELANLLFFIILILLIFLKFNFPYAKVFLGDSGSYFLGVFISISVIETSLANPNISPFYFCILLFYLFFEVFFSFFRKLIREKTSPIFPDKKHLHMLIYQMLLQNNGNKLKSNYQVSLIINLVYLALIVPAILMMKNGVFCKYYSILFFIVYFFSYMKVSKKIK